MILKLHRILGVVAIAGIACVAMFANDVVRAKPALAAPDPQYCAGTADDGNTWTEVGAEWECRCVVVSGGTDIFCSWVLIEDDAIQSLANGNYVSTELGYTGGDYAELRARSSSIGSWEQYSIGPSGAGDGTWAIRSLANGHYVTAQIGYCCLATGELTATASTIGSWERFYLYHYSWGYAFLSAANNCFVTAELGYPGGSNGMLRARASSIGSWEQFGLAYLGGSSYGSVVPR